MSRRPLPAAPPGAQQSTIGLLHCSKSAGGGVILAPAVDFAGYFLDLAGAGGDSAGGEKFCGLWRWGSR